MPITHPSQSQQKNLPTASDVRNDLGNILKSGFDKIKTTTLLVLAPAIMTLLDSANDNSEKENGTDSKERTSDDPLPRDKDGNPVPDDAAEGSHTQLGTRQGRKGPYR